MSAIAPNLPDPPSVDYVRREVENVRQQNAKLSQDQINMIIGAEGIKGDIRTINLQLKALWALLLFILSGCLLLAWTFYTRLDDKIDKNQEFVSRQYEKMSEKIDSATKGLESSALIIKGISDNLKNTKSK